MIAILAQKAYKLLERLVENQELQTQILRAQLELQRELLRHELQKHPNIYFVNEGADR